MMKWALAAWACCVSGALAEGPTAEEIIAQSKATYAAMETYSAKGTVTVVQESATGPVRTQAKFETLARRPAQELTKWTLIAPAGEPIITGAKWRDGTRLASYFHSAVDNSKHSLDLGWQYGVLNFNAPFAPQVPNFISGGDRYFPTPLDHLEDLEVGTDTVVDGEACYRVTGAQFGHPITVWISTHTHMIVQLQRTIVVESRQVPQAIHDGGKVEERLNDNAPRDKPSNLTGAPNWGFIDDGTHQSWTTEYLVTETYTDVQSPPLDDEVFKLEVPEGAQLQEFDMTNWEE